MSVYIPGMEMPTSCADCRFYGEYCYAKGDENKYSKLPCPLVPVPEHGRLIDADKLRENEFTQDGDAYAVVMSRHIRNAPTIIPADKEAGE